MANAVFADMVPLSEPGCAGSKYAFCDEAAIEHASHVRPLVYSNVTASVLLPGEFLTEAKFDFIEAFEISNPQSSVTENNTRASLISQYQSVVSILRKSHYESNPWAPRGPPNQTTKQSVKLVV